MKKILKKLNSESIYKRRDLVLYHTDRKPYFLYDLASIDNIAPQVGPCVFMKNFLDCHIRQILV